MKTKLVVLTLLCLATVSNAQTPQTMTIKLYFAKNAGGDCPAKVAPVTRTIPKTTAVAKAALDQLFAGPTAEEKAKGFSSDFTDETSSFLKSVNVKNGVAYVNLKDLTTVGSVGNFTTSCGGSNFLGQVEGTLKQFPTIKKVFFAIEGSPRDFYDWMQVGECPKELRKCDASNFIK